MKRHTRAEVLRQGAYVEWVKAYEAEAQRDELRERAEKAELQVSGLAYLVKEGEKHVDQLREALEDICACINETRGSNAHDALMEARAALKATDNDH